MFFLKKWRENSRKRKEILEKIAHFPNIDPIAKLADFIENSPEIVDSLLKLAEKCAHDAVLQKIFDETQTKNMDAAFLKKLVDSAQAGVVINVKMANADFSIRKEDIGDDFAKQRLRALLSEGGITPDPFTMRELESRR